MSPNLPQPPHNVIGTHDYAWPLNIIASDIGWAIVVVALICRIIYLGNEVRDLRRAAIECGRHMQIQPPEVR